MESLPTRRPSKLADRVVAEVGERTATASRALRLQLALDRPATDDEIAEGTGIDRAPRSSNTACRRAKPCSSGA